MSSSVSYCPFPSFIDWAEVPVQLRYWREAKRELAEFREKASTSQVGEAARFVTRATAVDTSAIEGIYAVDRGFTLSVTAEAGAWEHEFEEKGQGARQHFEAQLRASELVRDAATRRLPVVEALIRGLHEQVCAAKETFRVWASQGWQDQDLTRGEYKRLPNNPLRNDGQEHAYAPVERVQEEMRRLVTELGSEAFDPAPAPVQAAYAHHAFVSIHPFADGNGRVARALASIYLVRATSVPFLLFADQKAVYLDALEAADRGSYRPLVESVRDRSIAAMNYMSLQLQKALAPLAGEVRESSWRRFEILDPAEAKLDALAMRFLDEAGAKLEAAFESLAARRGLSGLGLMAEPRGRSRWMPLTPPDGYRGVRNPIDPRRGFVLRGLPFDSDNPAACLFPWVSEDEGHPMRLRIEDVLGKTKLDASPSDLTPDLAQNLQARMALWVEALAAQIAARAFEEPRPLREGIRSAG